jgi:hypothetical protein
LAAIQVAISLTWIIYILYLIPLLTQFGFAKELSTVLLLIETLLAVVMEPLMGGLSDQAQQWIGSRFPFISIGVVLASALFIAIPAVIVFGNPISVMHWVLPGVMVAWALAMTVFCSPALCLLNRYAVSTKLPHAASVLTLASELVRATGSIASQFILSLGPVTTFAIGSIVLLGAAVILRFLNPEVSISLPAVSARPASSRRISILALGLIFGTGMGVSLGFRFLTEIFRQLPGTKVGLVLGRISLAIALVAVPAGMLAARLRNSWAMLFALGAMVGGLGLIIFIHQGE